MAEQVNSRPDLSQLRVLEFDSGVAGAFATAMLADHGADTIICEGPSGSPLRTLGPEPVQDVWWATLARNKRSLAIDATRPDSEVILERLKASASVVVDGAVNDRAESDGAMGLHVYPTGADDPNLWGWGTAPELAGAATGMMAITGWAAGPPVQPEFPLADYTTGMMGAASTLLELRASHLEMRRPIDLSLATHETMLRMNEWQLGVASAMGKPEFRVGNRLPMNTNVGSIFETGDGKLLTVSAATQAVIMRLIAMVGGEEAAKDLRFQTIVDRKENMDALEEIIAAWMLRHDADDAMRQVQAHDVVAGPIFDAEDLKNSRQLAARGAITHLDTAGGDSVAMPAVLPALPGLSVRPRWSGCQVGEHTDEILAALGFTAAEIDAFRRSGAVWK